MSKVALCKYEGIHTPLDTELCIYITPLTHINTCGAQKNRTSLWNLWVAAAGFSTMNGAGLGASVSPMSHLASYLEATPAAQCGRAEGRWVESDYRVV